MGTEKTSLDILEASVNSILLNIGSTFAEPPSGSSARFEQTRARLRSTIPSAVDGFHTALDSLESDLIHATAVLSRDLAALQARSERVTNNNAGATQSQSEDPKHNGHATLDERHVRSSNESERSGLGSDVIMIDDEPREAEGNMAEDGKPPATDINVDVTKDPEHSSVSGVKEVDASANPEEHRSVQDVDPAAPEASKGIADIFELQSKDSDDKIEAAIQRVPVDTSNDVTSSPLPETAPSLDEENDLLNLDQDDPASGLNISGVQTESKQAEASPSDDFSALLPGLDMYANDPSGDPLNGIEGFTDMSTSNAFNEATEDQFNDFSGDLFGEGNMSNDFAQNGGGFDDLISFDTDGNASAPPDGGGGGLDLFDENFFNLGGT